MPPSVDLNLIVGCNLQKIVRQTDGQNDRQYLTNSNLKLVTFLTVGDIAYIYAKINYKTEHIEPANMACIRGVTIQEKRIAIFFHCIAIYCDTLFSLYFHRNPINYSIFAFTLNLTCENQNYTHTHVCLKTFNKGINVDGMLLLDLLLL